MLDAYRCAEPFVLLGSVPADHLTPVAPPHHSFPSNTPYLSGRNITPPEFPPPCSCPFKRDVARWHQSIQPPSLVWSEVERVLPSLVRRNSVHHMRSPMPPSRRSSQSEGWVVIETEFQTGAHTRSRSPQYNGDNMSSGQVANASSNNPVVALPEAGVVDDTRSSAAARNKTESNGSSTETGGTEDTMTGLNTAGRRSEAGLSIAYPEATPLTESNMDQHQRELHQYYTSSILGWVAGAGIGDRLSGSFAASLSHGMPSASSIPSAASSAPGPEWLMIPPPIAAAADEVAAAGAWCDRSLGPLVPPSSSLSLDG
ncbi:hypothetical protein VTK56DRAFT_4759 [Thermocarpiscus australiensis]